MSESNSESQENIENLEIIERLEIEDKARLEQIKKRYKGKIVIKSIIIVLLLFVLFCFTIGQMLILKQSFSERFDIDEGVRIFNIEASWILSGMIAGFLPISSTLDESGFARVMRVRIKETNFSAIWILFIFDLILTWQAILSFVVIRDNGSKNLFQLIISLTSQKPLIAFCVAAVFSTATIYLTRGIVSIRKEVSYLEDDLNTVIVHKFDPHPSYKDAEHIRLNEEREAAVQKLKEEKFKYEEDLQLQKIQYEQEILGYQKELESQKQDYENQIESQEILYTEEINNLQNKIDAYEEYFDSINELKKNFNQARKPILELVSQGKTLFEKFSQLDEQVKNLKFPNLNVQSDSQTDTEVIEQPVYYYSSPSWQNLPLPSELSPISNKILSVLEPELPEPIIEYYAPRDGLAKCLVLNFIDHNVIVYCRDEEYKQGQQWTDEDNYEFKKMFNQKRIDGFYPLEYTAQEIIENTESILEQTKSVINSQQNII